MLLNNALLNYCLLEGQVLVCTARCEKKKSRRSDEGEGGRGGVKSFRDFKYEKVALPNMKRSKCLKMCYTSRDIISG